LFISQVIRPHTQRQPALRSYHPVRLDTLGRVSYTAHTKQVVRRSPPSKTIWGICSDAPRMLLLWHPAASPRPSPPAAPRPRRGQTEHVAKGLSRARET